MSYGDEAWARCIARHPEEAPKNNDLQSMLRQMHANAYEVLKDEASKDVAKFTHEIAVAINRGQTFVKRNVPKTRSEACRDQLKALGYKVRLDFDANDFLNRMSTICVWGWSEVEPSEHMCYMGEN